jgi:hypothetical protein
MMAAIRRDMAFLATGGALGFPSRGRAHDVSASSQQPLDELPEAGWIQLKVYRGDEEFVSRYPIRVDISRDPEDGGILVSAPYLCTAASGGDLNTAVRDLVSSVEAAWIYLAEEPDAALADDARVLKRRLSVLMQ